MKKLVLAFSAILFSCLSLPSLAQKGIQIGVEGGPSIVSIRGSDWINRHYEATVGYTFGFNGQFDLSTLFSVKTGLLFERKGAFQSINLHDLFENDDDVFLYGGELEEKRNFNYLTLPILLKMKISDKKVKWYVNSGPYFSYLLDATYSLKAGDEVISSGNITSGYKRFDVGIVFVFGANIPIKEKLLLMVELRDNLGIYDIHEEDFYSTKTNAFSLLLGVSYKI